MLNFPHFANSYQLLYTGIGGRIFGAGSSRKVQLRYVWAGFIAPVLIGGFLFPAYDRRRSYAAELRRQRDGVHDGLALRKQGYGVISVLSAIRRIYYSEIEKRLLLLNGYVVWIYSWMALNQTLHEDTLYGVTFFTFDMPPLLLTIGAAAAMLTTSAVVVAFAVRVLVRRQSVSWNGAVGTRARSICGSWRFYYDLIFRDLHPGVPLAPVPALHLALSVEQGLVGVRRRDGGAGGDALAARRSALCEIRGWRHRARVDRVHRGLPLLFHAGLLPDPKLFGSGGLRLHLRDVDQHPSLLHRQCDLATR